MESLDQARPTFLSARPAHKDVEVPGLTFQRRRQKIDWRNLASLNVDRLVSEVDIDTLQKNINNITFCDIESEEWNGLDPNFIKLFRMAQLMLEYVLHTQEYLIRKNSSLETDLTHLREEFRDVKTHQEELRMQAKLQKRTLNNYQNLFQLNEIDTYSCKYCAKTFLNNDFLMGHLKRRHAEYAPFDLSRPKTKKEIMADQLKQQEDIIAQLKQELQSTKIDLQGVTEQKARLIEDYKNTSAMKQVIEVSRLEQEKEFKIELEKREDHHEKVRKELFQHHEDEMLELNSRLNKQIKRLQEDYSSTNEELSLLKAEYEKEKLKQRQSNLGQLQDGSPPSQKGMKTDEVKALLEKQKQKYERKLLEIKETYQGQLNNSMERVAVIERDSTKREKDSLKAGLEDLARRENALRERELQLFQQNMSSLQQQRVTESRVRNPHVSRQNEPKRGALPSIEVQTFHDDDEEDSDHSEPTVLRSRPTTPKKEVFTPKRDAFAIGDVTQSQDMVFQAEEDLPQLTQRSVPSLMSPNLTSSIKETVAKKKMKTPNFNHNVQKLTKARLEGLRDFDKYLEDYNIDQETKSMKDEMLGQKLESLQHVKEEEASHRDFYVESLEEIKRALDDKIKSEYKPYSGKEKQSTKPSLMRPITPTKDPVLTKSSSKSAIKVLPKSKSTDLVPSTRAPKSILVNKENNSRDPANSSSKPKASNPSEPSMRGGALSLPLNTTVGGESFADKSSALINTTLPDVSHMSSNLSVTEVTHIPPPSAPPRPAATLTSGPPPVPAKPSGLMAKKKSEFDFDDDDDESVPDELDKMTISEKGRTSSPISPMSSDSVESLDAVDELLATIPKVSDPGSTSTRASGGAKPPQTILSRPSQPAVTTSTIVEDFDDFDLSD